MGGTVKNMVKDLASKPMNWMEDRISGGSSTSNTLFSKLADPFRQMRQHNQAGGGTSPEDMADPLGHVHGIDSPAKMAQDRQNEAAAAQYELDKLRPPDLASSMLSGQQASDRQRRRRGILANIFAGSSGGGSVSVGTKTLLG